MKKVIEFIKELKKKPYGKSVMFFGFYLIFFIVIGLIYLFGDSPYKKSDTENTPSYNSFFDTKYNFTYKVELDGENYIYSVNKKHNEYSFIYDNKEYTMINNDTYIEEDVIENPIKFSNLFNENKLLKILDGSYRESKTTYDNGDEVYNLLVSSNTLNKILDKKDTDFEEIPNKIKMIIRNKKVKEINYNLDSYCKLNKLCNEELNIIIVYNT